MRSIEKTNNEEKNLKCMKKAAIEAGLYIKEQFVSKNKEIALKSRQGTHDDFVTGVDKKAEQIIRTILKETGIPVVGEEEGGDKATQYFLVDPLDGTTNFISDVPYFATCIALIDNEESIMSVMGNPVSGAIYHATKDKGAFCNDVPIMTSREAYERLLVITETTPDRVGILWENVQAVTGQSRFAGFRKFGSTALDLAEMASGKPYIVAAENLKPWDFAAGWLLVKEAGGMILDGDQEGSLTLNTQTIVATPYL